MNCSTSINREIEQQRAHVVLLEGVQEILLVLLRAVVLVDVVLQLQLERAVYLLIGVEVVE